VESDKREGAKYNQHLGRGTMKPRKQERPKAYYEARELIAECFGLSDDRDPEPASPEEEFRALFRAAVDRTED
jgi:hypothetical protein